MQKRDIFLIIIISLLLVIFATQNANLIAVKLWFVKFNISVSLLIIFSLLIGAAVSWFFAFKELKKRKKLIHEKDVLIKKFKEEKTEKDPLNIGI